MMEPEEVERELEVLERNGIVAKRFVDGEYRYSLTPKGRMVRKMSDEEQSDYFRNLTSR